MQKLTWERGAAMLFCIAVGLVAAFFGVRYLLPVLLPFAVSWGISLLIRPLARRLSARIRVPERVCAIGLLILFWGVVSLLVYVSVHRLVLELRHLLERLVADGQVERLLGTENDYFSLLTEQIHLPGGFSRFREGFNAAVGRMLEEVLSTLSAKLPALAGRLMAALPTLFLSLAVTVIAGFYFCTAREPLGGKLAAYLPASIRERLPRWRMRAKRLSWRYLRAYLLLWLLTFCILFFGFCLLRVDYAFLLAFFVALIDMLPVLGVGTVVVPWAVFEMLSKHYFMGTALLILYVAVLITRQLAEPRLLGKSLGLHPLLTLFATFAGWQLFGFLGMLLGPVAAVLAKSVLENCKRA